MKAARLVTWELHYYWPPVSFLVAAVDNDTIATRHTTHCQLEEEENKAYIDNNSHNDGRNATQKESDINNDVTLTVTDENGASDSCSATVTLLDSSTPSISCPFTADDVALAANDVPTTF